MKNKKDISILKKLSTRLEKEGFHPSIDNEILDVCGSSSIFMDDEDIITISFEMNAPVTWVAFLTQSIIEFANIIDCKVEIYEPYIMVIEDDTCVEVLWGEEAEYYHHTGELPKDFEKDKKNKNQKEDEEPSEISSEKPSEKVDKLLEQIHSKGIKSLKKSQKKFLEDFAKGKIGNGCENK